MARDKFNEVQVALVKDVMARQHSALCDFKIQTLVRSLSVMTAIHKHNLRARLYEFQSRFTSTDVVGDENRQLLQDLMARNDPFNLERAPETDFAHKSAGSPFAGLTRETMNRFLQSVSSEFEKLYPAACTTVVPK